MGKTGRVKKYCFLFLFISTFTFCLASRSFSENEKVVLFVAEKGYDNDKRGVSLVGSGGDKSILIRLGRTHFDPLRVIPDKEASVPEIQAYPKGEKGYYIVQFDGPIRSSWKRALKETGVEIFDYIPDFAFIARMDSTKEGTVRGLPHVRWVGIYQPSYRISQGALDKVFVKGGESADSEEGLINKVLLSITIFPGEGLEPIRSAIAGLDGIILDEVSTSWKTTLKVEIPVDKLDSLPGINGIKWIEPWPKWRLYNNVSTDVMNARAPRDIHGLYGEGQTVGVCDSGLDEGSTDPADLHEDFLDGAGLSRVTQIFDLVGDGASDVNSGHGTHVAGSVLGNGKRSGSDPSSNSFPSSCFAGLAPKADLVFQAAENNATGKLSGLPSDLNTLFSQADGAGADLHTNSWGSTVSGKYTSRSEEVDEYVWDNRDFLILFAAGNDGIDMDGDGVIDQYSVGSPATAKNCLTVGASEGDRPTGEGYDHTWGYFNSYEYSADPIYSDHVSNHPNGMAAFSSRGPCLDARFKPDIVAPGTNILSTRSSVASGTGWGGYDDYYLWNGGTSMATPLAAGAAALMRKYLIDVKSHPSPSAALIKAALLNSAEDTSPGQYGTGSAQETPNPPVPNNVEGWGRLNLGKGVYPTSPSNILYYDVQSSLSTGEDAEYDVIVTSSRYPLKVNLVWTDYPGSAVAQGGLVNDLDLLVKAPSSVIHYPDNASQKSTISTLSYDKDTPIYVLYTNKLAVKFTPLSYPLNLESTTFDFYNPDKKTTDVDIVVYDDNGSEGLPGTELFRKTLTYVPSGWVTMGITGVTVSSTDFYIAIEMNSDKQAVYADPTDPSGRSYYYNGSKWVKTGYAAYIRANVRGADYSTSFDRVNNVVGLTLDNPTTGKYTITVSGYNVPHGPQPYALVVSGAVAGFPTGVIYVESTGSCGKKTPCYSTIQDAVEAADTYTIIFVAGGNYNEHVTLSTSKILYLKGGYDPTFTTQSSETILRTMTVSKGTAVVDKLTLY